MSKLAIDVWSDVACPWCYIGKRRLEAALDRFEHRDEVELTWHSFELDPSAPAVTPPSLTHVALLAKKFGTTPAAAQSMIDRVAGVAAQDGLAFRLDIARSGNTFDAHRLVHWAHTQGKQDAMKERLFKAYFTEGEAVGDRAVLTRLAREVGLDEERAHEMLLGDDFAKDVRADEDDARRLGITGVPFFVVGERFAVSGAQPADVILGALQRAWSERAPSLVKMNTDGEACGPEGCD